MISFTKMHGIGNDYIYIDCTGKTLDRLPELSIEMSNRHTGVGGDGVILILPSSCADFRMRIFNADGSEARMCGNGSRCVGKYVYDHKLTDKTQITLETLSGVKYLSLHVNPENNKVENVTVDMGKPSLLCSEIGVNSQAESLINHKVVLSQGEVELTAVSMGNPHGVVFGPDPDEIDVERIGRELELHPMWTDRANIEFIQVIDSHTLKMRVWERGSGETMACGTGACAAAVAAITTGRCQAPVTVNLRGGDLLIDISDDGNVMMTGPATEVFSAVYYPRLYK